MVVQIISKQESKILADFGEFAHLQTLQPQSLKVKQKTIDRLIERLHNYQENTNYLYSQCMYKVIDGIMIFLKLITIYFFTVKKKYRKEFHPATRRELRHEFYLRTAHNQQKVNTIMETIRCFLRQKYVDEFDELLDVIPKLNRYMCYLQQLKRNGDLSELSCSEDMLKLDLFEHVRKYTQSIPEIRPMTPEENFLNRRLIDDQETTKFLPDRELMEKPGDYERAIDKPYHDQNL